LVVIERQRFPAGRTGAAVGIRFGRMRFIFEQLVAGAAFLQAASLPSRAYGRFLFISA
jgi:hypothetical protein